MPAAGEAALAPFGLGKTTPAYPEREQNHAAANLGAAIQMQHVKTGRRGCWNKLLDFDRRYDPRAKLQHLQNTARSELGAT